MYKVYQIFIMILKFDIFFQLGFSAQFLSVVVLQQQENFTDKEFVLTKEQMTSILVVHLILSTGAAVILPFLAWFGVSVIGSTARIGRRFVLLCSVSR